MLEILSPAQATSLRKDLLKTFDLSELKTLCVDLGVDFENLNGENKVDKVRELIAFLERRGRINDLIEYSQSERPNINWSQLLELETAREKFKETANNIEALNFWKTFTNGELQVVIGKFNQFERFEASGLVGFGDAAALIELSSLFATLDLQDFKIAYASKMEKSQLGTNLIVLGGPDANPVANAIVNELNACTLKFGNPDRNEIALFDSTSKQTYAPFRWFDSVELNRDYAIIYRTKNPFNKEKNLLLIAGSFGYGTWAGIRYITSSEFLNSPSSSSLDEFECLIEVDVFQDSPQIIRLVTMRDLKA